MNNFPRRHCINQYSEAEAAIAAAMEVVERAGADIRLTEAVDLLGKAKDRVADFVDGVKPEPVYLKPAAY